MNRWRTARRIRAVLVESLPSSARVRQDDLALRRHTHLSDEALVALVARGDESALGELYDRVGRVAYGIAYRVLRDDRLAEDAVQEGFLAAWRSATAFRAERAKASTWIVTLVHRRAVDIVRREERRRAEPLEPRAGAEPPDPSGSAEDAAWLGFERDRVQAALARAPRHAARGDRARLLRRLLAGRAGREAGSAAGYDQEQDVRRPRAPTGAAGRGRIRGIMDAETHELIAGYALDALDEGDRARAKELLELVRGGARGASLAHRGRGRDGDRHCRPRALRRAARPDPRRREGRAAERRLRSRNGAGRGSCPLSGSRQPSPRAPRSRSACGARPSPPTWTTRAPRSRRSGLRPPFWHSRRRKRRLTGARGRLVVGDDGRAVLVVSDVPPVPAGKTYQVWVIDDGRPVSGGLFAPGNGTLAIPVDGTVGNGSVVAVTVEDDGGASAPTGKPVIASAPVSLS